MTTLTGKLKAYRVLLRLHKKREKQLSTELKRVTDSRRLTEDRLAAVALLIEDE